MDSRRTSSRDRGGEDRGGRDRDRSSRDRGDSRERSSSRESSRRGGSRYQYQSRSPDATKKRGEQSAGDFDKYLIDSVKTYKVADGDNFIRFLPPTFENPEHYGMDIFVHYGIGPDNQTYLCLHKMKGERCPICEERARAQKDGDDDYAKKLEPKKRVLVYLIDREEEKAGVQAWAMPWTLDRDICKVSVDKRTGEAFELDNPDDGYDVEFEKKGSKDRTEYIGVSIARRSSPLGNDDWLDEIQEKPLDTILQFYEYDHILKEFGGGGSELDREQEKGLRASEERGVRNHKGSRDEPALDWDAIHGMTFDEMCTIIDDEKLGIDPDKSKDDEDLADWICEEMKIEKVAPRSSRRTVEKSNEAEDSPGSRLRNMRQERDKER